MTDTPQQIDTKEAANRAISAPGSAPAAAPVLTGGVSGSNVNGGTGSVTRSTPAPRVNPDSIPTTPATDKSNPANANSFFDYKSASSLSPDETKTISDRYTDQLQKENDLINAQYAARTTGQQNTNEAQIARTRVLNSRYGNTDSGTGSAALAKEGKKGQDALDAIDTERSAKLQQALGQIDNLQEAAIEKATSKKQEDVKAYNDQLASNRKTAMESVKTLAESGTAIDALKADKGTDGSSSYEKLVKASGLTPLEFDVQFNALHDEAHQIKYEYKQVGDTLFAYGTDPKTGKISVQSQKVPGLEDGQWTHFETKDGRLFKQNAKTGQVLPIDAPVTDTTVDNTYTISAATTNKMQGGGMTKEEVANVQKGIRESGSIQAYVDSLTSTSTKAFVSKYLLPAPKTGGSA